MSPEVAKGGPSRGKERIDFHTKPKINAPREINQVPEGK